MTVRRAPALAGLFVAMLLAALDQTIIATALPNIVGSFGGLDRLSWVVTAYLLTSTTSTALFGPLGDRFGHVRTFLGAAVLFVGGSVVAALSQSLYQLVACRAVQGVGAGGLFVLSATLASELVGPGGRHRIQGALGAVFGLASVAGPLIGGWLAEGHRLIAWHTDWRWVFWLNLPLGLLAATLVGLPLARHEFPRRPAGIDWLGAVLLTAGVGFVLAVLVGSGQRPTWPYGELAAVAAGALVLLVAFGIRQARARSPLVPVRLLRLRQVALSCGVAFALGGVLFGAVIFLPIYLQVVDGVSPAGSGVLLLPLLGGLVVASVGAGALVGRSGQLQPYPVAGTALTGLGLWLLHDLTGTSSRVHAGLAMAVLGVGLGLVVQVLIAAVQDEVHTDDVGVATSTVTFFRTLGGAVGTAVFGSVLYARVYYWAHRLLPGGEIDQIDLAKLQATPAEVRRLPTGGCVDLPVVGRHCVANLRDPVISAFVHGSSEVFLTALPFALVALTLAAYLRSARTWHPAEPSESVAVSGAPGDTEGPRSGGRNGRQSADQ